MKQIRNPHQLHLFRSSRFITTGEAAAMLNVCRGTVNHLIDEGLLRSFQRRNGGWKMVTEASVLELLENWAEQVFAATPQNDATEARCRPIPESRPGPKGSPRKQLACAHSCLERLRRRGDLQRGEFQYN